MQANDNEEITLNTLKPTAEQQEALDVFATGENLILEAGAGTGKTSTLTLLARADNQKGLYVAYNKSIADEAKSKFPRNVDCRTAHSLAYGAVGARYRDRLNAGFQPWWKVAKRLGIDHQVVIGERYLAANTLARLAMEMVGNFCNSADAEVTTRHRPFVDGLRTVVGDAEIVDWHPQLAEELLPFAQRAWDALQDPADVDSAVRFTHDHYLKMWQLTKPRLHVDYILFDEAQDANPVIADVISQQRTAQIVAVGDRAQAIYGWRGAVDFMEDGVRHAERRFLSQSWRFGEVVAEEANRWLGMLDTPLRLTGNPAVDSLVHVVDEPRATLCRTNAGALQVLLDAQAVGRSGHLVGGATDIGKFCDAAQQLQTTGKTSHRDLIAFSSWDEVVEYAKESKQAAGDLGTWVNILTKHGIEVVRGAVNKMASEDKADLVISTAHKAKGREWDSVRIAEDFAPQVDKETGDAKDLSPAEVMLRYVAVTRAKVDLDLGPLAEAVS